MSEDIYSNYETVVGLEIHIQLNTKSKAYSSEHYEYGALPNTKTSVVTLGHPGTLPVINQRVIDSAVLLGMAIGSDIRREMHYARKNYFYPDLPKGYQITQDDTPICTGGKITVKLEDGTKKSINITRIHMEEDAGKSIHDQDPFHTLVDLNRAGVPLLEIVSEPELRSGEEAYQYVTEVRKLVRYLGICDGNMEEGSLRCDANISVRRKGETVFGTRAEVKNMNSFRHVQKAIEFEARRQIDLVEAGGVVAQETRSYDMVNNTTFSMRSKEMAHDYRYFPEPDIQPVVLEEVYLEKMKASLPALPAELFEKYTKELGLSTYDAALLSDDKEVSDYFEAMTTHTKNFKASANWMLGEIKSYLNQNGVGIKEFPISEANMSALIHMIDEGKINRTIASQKIFPEMIKTGETAEKIAHDLNMIQDSSDDEIIEIAREALDAYPEKVKEYKAGKKGVLGLFMGEFMKKAKGKADPKKANQIIQKLLEE